MTEIFHIKLKKLRSCTEFFFFKSVSDSCGHIFFKPSTGGWSNSGFAAELLAQVSENLSPSYLKVSPKRITLVEAPAPTSSKLEDIYYLTPVKLKEHIKNIFTIND